MTCKKSLCRSALVLLVAAAMLMTMAVPAFAAGAGDFSDVSSSNWYYNAVDFVASNGLFEGMSPGVFYPNGTMTRAMFITVLGRYAGADTAEMSAASVTGGDAGIYSGAGEEEPLTQEDGAPVMLTDGTAVTIQKEKGDWYEVTDGTYTGYVQKAHIAPSHHTFSDVSFGSYYAGYAMWAFENDIIEGDGSDTVFSPDDNVTREQLCAILGRFASKRGLSIGSNGFSASFTDEGKISSWAKGNVTDMARAGIIKGRTNGAFDPWGSATRAEAAAILHRFDAVTHGRPLPDEPQSSCAPLDTVNLARIDHLSQGDRHCCLATAFSMAANLILGRNEYGAFSWTASDTNDGLMVPVGTTFRGSDGHTYRPVWSSGGLDENGLRSAINNALSNGCPIIGSVKNSSTYTTHYVLFIGWTDASHSEFLIVDPSGGGTTIRDSAMAMSEKNYSLGNADGTYVYINFTRS